MTTNTETNKYSEGYEDGFNDGHENSYNLGYSDGQKQSEDMYEQRIEFIRDEHASELDKAEKDGFDEAETKYCRLLDQLKYNMENLVDDLNSTIINLRHELFELRKENAAITRSIQKNP